MRRTVIAGNWKMNLDQERAAGLLNEVARGVERVRKKGTDVVVCPPFTSLSLASDLIRGTKILLGAQNMSEHEEGAYTGEISGTMLRSVGCSHVILGHSERRQLYGETDELIHRKMVRALGTGLIPILCVGETLEQREAGDTEQVVGIQLRGGLSNLPDAGLASVIVAYEPVWAIGTGKTASPEQAQEVHAFIRSLLKELAGPKIAAETVIQYGGSVKPENAVALLACDDIDGALVGGACLKPESFLAIIDAARA